MPTAEHLRLAEPSTAIVPPWRRWGCYVTDRAWGTVREDYSADGDAWNFLPHDKARSKAYRWGEDGIAGLCDRYQLLDVRAGVLERPRSDPQGADVRPDVERRQPRRGRQGVLLLPRRHAVGQLHEDALQVSARRVSLRAAARREPPPRRRAAWSSSCSTPASSTTIATSTSSSSTPRRAPTTSASASRRSTAGRTRPSCTCCRTCGSATRGAGAPSAGRAGHHRRRRRARQRHDARRSMATHRRRLELPIRCRT